MTLSTIVEKQISNDIISRHTDPVLWLFVAWALYCDTPAVAEEITRMRKEQRR